MDTQKEFNKYYWACRKVSEYIPFRSLGNITTDYKPIIREPITDEEKDVLQIEISKILDFSELDDFCFEYTQFRQMPYTEELLLSSLIVFFKNERFKLKPTDLTVLITNLFPQLLHCFRVLNPEAFDIEFNFDSTTLSCNVGELKFWLRGTDRDYGYCWWFEKPTHPMFVSEYGRFSPYKLGKSWGGKDTNVRFFIDIDIF